MTQAQLVETILEAYSARPEIKEYFEFFLNPDSEALMEKFLKGIFKELGRFKRGHYSKARISFIRKQIKLFESFRPGTEWCIRIRLATVTHALKMSRLITYLPTITMGMAEMLTQALELADQSGEIKQTVAEVDAILSHANLGNRYFRNNLQTALTSFLTTPKTALPK